MFPKITKEAARIKKSVFNMIIFRESEDKKKELNRKNNCKLRVGIQYKMLEDHFSVHLNKI